MIKVTVRDAGKKKNDELNDQMDKIFNRNIKSILTNIAKCPIRSLGQSDVYNKNNLHPEVAKTLQNMLDVGRPVPDGTYIGFDLPTVSVRKFTPEEQRDVDGVYRRTISKSMARGLKILYDNFIDLKFVKCYNVGELFLFQDDAKNLAADFAKLRHWGLISPCKEESDFSGRKYSIGCYKITPKGTLFVEGATSVLKFIYINKDGNKVDNYCEENGDHTALMYFNDVF